MNGAKVRPRRRRRACVLLDKQINSHSRNTQNSRRVVERGRKLMMGERERRERYLNTGTRFFLGGVRTLGRKFGRKRVRVCECGSKTEDITNDDAQSDSGNALF